ncbi:hypothetical protein V5735_07880 (plasmid) [Haladaptatus sp. SPP-AMP-3]|uniref:hypothetical protein n=1 Tax=Haladaptatus sp. SPP-AMP-3 TaxID=3121295 RepID=UPI003C2E4BA9
MTATADVTETATAQHRVLTALPSSRGARPLDCSWNVVPRYSHPRFQSKPRTLAQ